MSTLQESRRELMVQLEQLMMLLKVRQTLLDLLFKLKVVGGFIDESDTKRANFGLKSLSRFLICDFISAMSSSECHEIPLLLKKG